MNIRGTDGNDRLMGTDDLDVIEGLGGDDTIRPGGGPDTLDGGTGDDTYLLDGAFGEDALNLLDYTIRDADGTDTIVFAASDAWRITFDQREAGVLQVRDESTAGLTFVTIDLSGGGVEQFVLANGTLVTAGDRFDGTDAADVLAGTDGNDRIDGLAGNDTLRGGGGGDQLFGDDGADLMEGGAGDDYLFARDVGDTVDGGAGTDVLGLFPDSNAIRLEFDLEQGGTQNGITARNVERLFATGGFGDDVLAGGSMNDVLDGDFEGADVLRGRGGDDFLRAEGRGSLLDGGDGADFLFATGEDTTLRGGAGNDVLVVLGSGVADGGSGDDRVDGLSVFSEADGDLVVEGGAGTDILILNSSTVNYEDRDIFSDDPLFFDLSNVFEDGAISESITISGFEAVSFLVEEFGSGTRVVGTSGGDELVSQVGADTLEGGAGDDLLVGGIGDDVLVGGDGDDVIYGDGGPG